MLKLKTFLFIFLLNLILSVGAFANPTFTDTPTGQWTLVASDVIAGVAQLQNAASSYWHIEIDANDAAPITRSEGAFIGGEYLDIGYQEGLVDVYIWSESTAGRIRWDPRGFSVPLETNGGVPVNIQDQTTPPFALFFAKELAPATTLSANTAIDDVSIVVTDPAGFAPGVYIGVFSGVSGEERYYFAEVLTVVTNTLGLDTPLDFAFESGDPAIALTRDLDVDGSTTPVVFSLAGSGMVPIDVTRIMITMQTVTTPDLASFGDITALGDGIVLRRVDGDIRNIWNIKRNMDFANLAYDLQFYSSIGQGADGLTCRYTFAGQDKHGVAVRLEYGESLQLIIQDNLTGLSQFRIIAEGHLLQN